MTHQIIKNTCRHLLAYLCTILFAFTFCLFLMLLLSMVIPAVDISNTVYNTIGYDKLAEIFRLDSTQHNDITVWIILSPINSFLGYFLVNIVAIFLFKATFFDLIAHLKYENTRNLRSKLMVKNTLFCLFNIFLIISFISIYQYTYSLLIFSLFVVMAIFANILSWKCTLNFLLNQITGLKYKSLT